MIPCLGRMVWQVGNLTYAFWEEELSVRLIQAFHISCDRFGQEDQALAGVDHDFCLWDDGEGAEFHDIINFWL
jgi:hypothetical protein